MSFVDGEHIYIPKGILLRPLGEIKTYVVLTVLGLTEYVPSGRVAEVSNHVGRSYDSTLRYLRGLKDSGWIDIDVDSLITNERVLQERLTDPDGYLMSRGLYPRVRYPGGTNTIYTGYPDLEVYYGTRLVFYVECKSERGQLTIDQAETQENLRRQGYPVFVWRPSDTVKIPNILNDIKTLLDDNKNLDDFIRSS